MCLPKPVGLGSGWGGPATFTPVFDDLGVLFMYSSEGTLPWSRAWSWLGAREHVYVKLLLSKCQVDADKNDEHPPERKKGEEGERETEKGGWEKEGAGEGANAWKPRDLLRGCTCHRSSQRVGLTSCD